MKTVLAKVDEQAIRSAGEIIRQGGLVAFPTETVYGLGANAFDEKAVLSIFAAKGRPADNPLIVHIADKNGFEGIVKEIPEKAQKLIDRFMPGPLTVILKKTDKVSLHVTAGLDTVAVRMPSNKDALALIRAAGVPIAAPSANRSGLPSPTRAQHVFSDMDGRIEMILDGGACTFGLESTVVDMSGDIPVLLRPGAVTLEQLKETVGEVILSGGVLSGLKEGEVARSPGLKHKHYAPKSARVVLLKGSDKAIAEHINRFAADNSHKVGAIVKNCVTSLDKNVKICYIGNEDLQYAQSVFDALRALDDLNVDIIFCQAVEEGGIGLAIMNRLLRSAGFALLDV